MSATDSPNIPPGGETCRAHHTAFYEDHERDMQDPEYREAFERFNRVLPPGALS